MYLTRRGTVRMWSIEKSEIDAMQKERANNRFMPGFELPDQIHPMDNLADAIKDVDDIIVVVPSVGFRHTLSLLKPLLLTHQRIICAAKGLDTDTGQLLSDVALEIMGKERQFAVLSGPSFAREVAAGLPCAVVIASQHNDFLTDLKTRFNSPLFRIYTSDDVIGVEVVALLKMCCHCNGDIR